MPGFNPLRSLFSALKNTSDKNSRKRSHSKEQGLQQEQQALAANRQVLTANRKENNRNARGRFAPMVNKRQLTAGLNRWVNARGIATDERRQRKIAKQRIVDAYCHQSPSLSLDRLSLTQLPNEIGQLHTLEKLNIEQNRLTGLPATLHQLTALSHLNLNHNQLTTLPAEMGQLVALANLTAAHNSICHITLDALPQKTPLAINLQSNPFASTTAVSLIKAQQQADYSGPRLTLDTLATIKEREFEAGLSRWLGEINGTHHERNGRQTARERIRLAYHQQSQQLSLSDLWLTGLPPEIGQLRTLRSLNVSRNRLTHLPIEIGQLSALRWLGLSNNQLTHIEVNTLPQNRDLAVSLFQNPFSKAVLQELHQRQDQADYRGPRLHINRPPRPLTLGGSDALATDNITAGHIKALLARLGHSDTHPLWSSLGKPSPMGNMANDFSLLLARLYHRAPRENNPIASHTRQHIDTVLTTLEHLHDQGRSQDIEEILRCAYDTATRGVDWTAVQLLLMSAKSQYCQTGDNQPLADINTINATIHFVASLNKSHRQQLVFDNNSGSFKALIDVTDSHYQTLAIHDEVADILYLLNSDLLHSVEVCDMYHGGGVTLKDQRYLDAARSAILNRLAPLEPTTDNVAPSTSPLAEPRRLFEASLENWANEKGLSTHEAQQETRLRQTAKVHIMEAYTQQRRQLSLSNLALTSLPPELCQLTHLSALGLQKNKLTQLPAALGQLTSLTKLNLEHNRLAYIDPELLPQSRDLTVYLRHNPMPSTAIDTLNQRQGHAEYSGPVLTLDAPATLKARELEIDLQDWVNEGNISRQQRRQRASTKKRIVEAYTQQSQHLSLSACLLDSLPPEIALLTELKALRLDQNQLTHLPTEMGRLTALEHLDLSHNQLETLPSDIGGLSHLKVLKLNGNRLTQLPTGLEDLTALTIDLRHNPLSSAALDQLKHIQGQANHNGPTIEY